MPKLGEVIRDNRDRQMLKDGLADDEVGGRKRLTDSCDLEPDGVGGELFSVRIDNEFNDVQSQLVHTAPVDESRELPVATTEIDHRPDLVIV